MKKTIFGFSLIGCGNIARMHALAVEKLESGRLVGVYDYSRERAEEFAKEFGCRAFSSVEELLNSEETDIVNICTPSGLHAEQAVAAAYAKKHIVIEKPMAITREQLDAVIDAVKENGVHVEVITQLRFTPAIIKLKQAIDEGRFGRILYADYRMKYYRSPEYYKSGGWRGTYSMDGGGALMNQGIHGVDLIQYLLGGVKSVRAQCRTLLHEIEVEDTANILVEYNCGAIGVIQGTTVAKPGYAREIEICGDKGTALIKEDIIVKWDIEGETVDFDAKSEFNSGSNPMDFSEYYHMLQLKDLTDAIVGGGKTLVDAKEGRKPVDIILAAYESSKTDTKVELV